MIGAPVMVWPWDEAPDEYRTRIHRSRARTEGLPSSPRFDVLAFIPGALLGQLLDEPAFLKPLWRAARNSHRCRLRNGSMLIAWT